MFKSKQPKQPKTIASRNSTKNEQYYSLKIMIPKRYL